MRAIGRAFSVWRRTSDLDIAKATSVAKSITETIVPVPLFLSPLKQKAFRSLWIATMMSNLGTLVQSVGASWVMATMMGSQAMVALVQTMNSLPVMIFSMIAGALADNYSRRRILIMAQGGMVLVSAVLATSICFNVLDPWLLLALTFLIGCGNALYNPAWQASIGDVISKEDVAGAVGLNGLSFNMMRSVGPASGGLVVVVAGSAAAFAANVLLTLPLIGALLHWKPHYPKPELPPSMWEQRLVPAFVTSGCLPIF